MNLRLPAKRPPGPRAADRPGGFRPPIALRIPLPLLACAAFAVLPAAAETPTPEPGGRSAAPYERIVSINLSADELVLQLADPENIAALSRMVFDPELSRLADRAHNFTATDGSAEEILRLRPDLVLAGEYSHRTTTELLEQTGANVVRLPVATNLEEARGLIRRVAGILNVPRRGEALIQDMDKRLRRLESESPASGNRPTALFYGQGGHTQGTGTLAHHILRAAGFKNHARSFGIEGEAELPLERLLLAPPDFLVRVTYYENDPTLGSILLRHRALRQLPGKMKVIEVPLAWTLTGNNLTARTAEHLHQQARESRKPSTPEAAP